MKCYITLTKEEVEKLLRCMSIGKEYNATLYAQKKGKSQIENKVYKYLSRELSKRLRLADNNYQPIIFYIRKPEYMNMFGDNESAYNIIECNIIQNKLIYIDFESLIAAFSGKLILPNWSEEKAIFEDRKNKCGYISDMVVYPDRKLSCEQIKCKKQVIKSWGNIFDINPKDVDEETQWLCMVGFSIDNREFKRIL
ncbi:MAG: DUF3841 domain-containing protein [Clostridia bacterium]